DRGGPRPGHRERPGCRGGPAEKEKSRAETENIQRGAHPVPDEGLQFEPGPDIRRLGLGVGAFRMADAGPTSAQIVEAEQVRTRDTILVTLRLTLEGESNLLGQRRRAEAIVKAASASSVDAAAVSPVNESGDGVERRAGDDDDVQLKHQLTHVTRDALRGRSRGAAARGAALRAA
ncbi:hypothetical protein THAOC_29603, partial [Thalassiosira oceanica]